MAKIIKKTRSFFLFLILLISCNNYYNTKQLNIVSSLQKTTTEDYTNLSFLKINDIENTLKIAKLNLAKIEEKELDSVTIELIYFEYKNYLNCINIIYESIDQINTLNNILSTNKQQLRGLKDDYTNSRSKRKDLAKYLLEEIQIINETSKMVNNIIEITQKETIRFNHLNKEIEELMKI